MPSFSYAAYDQNGKRVSGQISARTEAEVHSLLTARGLLPFETTALVHVHQRPGKANDRLHPLNLTEFADLFRQLATLAAAELPIDQCLRLLTLQSPSQRAKNFAEALSDAVIGGRSLSSAFEVHGQGMPPFVVPLVRAGEARGQSHPLCKMLLFSLSRVWKRKVKFGAPLSILACSASWRLALSP
jgi:type II secretory pathway component PulF